MIQANEMPQKLLLPFIFAYSALSAQNSFALMGGARDGGGGGKILQRSVTASNIEDVMQDSVPAIYLGYATLSRAYALQHSPDAKADPIERLLFTPSPTIFDVLLSATVEENKTSACLSPLGEEDGSAPGSKPNSICISVVRLATGLNQDDMLAQTYALMAREYSHLLWFDETQADWVQNEVYDLLPQYAGASITILSGVDQVSTLASQAQLLATTAAYSASTCQALSSLQKNFLKLSQVAIPSAGLSVVDTLAIDDYRLFQGNTFRLNLLLAATCGSDPTSFNSAFQNNAQLSLSQLETALHISYPNLDAPTFEVANILSQPSQTQLQKEVAALADFLNQLQSKLQQLAAVGP